VEGVKYCESSSAQTLLDVLRQYSSVEILLKNENAEAIACLAFWFSLHVIKGRWPEAEEIIKKDAQISYYYAFLVIEGRWPEAEEIIKNDEKIAKSYESFLSTLSTT